MTQEHSLSKSDPFKVWIVTLVVSPLFPIILDFFTPVRNVILTSLESYLFALLFGATFSLPVYAVYQFTFSYLNERKIARKTIPVILLIEAITGIVVLTYLIGEPRFKKIGIFYLFTALLHGSLDACFDLIPAS